MLLGVLVLLLSWIGEVCWLLGGSWQVSSVGATVHRGDGCGVDGIEICLMRLLSLSRWSLGGTGVGCVLSSVDTGYGDLSQAA